MATLGSVIKSLFSGLLRGDDKRTKKIVAFLLISNL